MVVAVIPVDVVQVAAHQIVHVVAVRDGFVAAVGPMDMTRVVAAAAVRRRACVRVGLRDGDHVLIDVTVVGVMQVTIMEVVNVTIMQDGLMAAIGAVNMVM